MRILDFIGGYLFGGHACMHKGGRTFLWAVLLAHSRQTPTVYSNLQGEVYNIPINK